MEWSWNLLKLKLFYWNWIKAFVTWIWIESFHMTASIPMPWCKYIHVIIYIYIYMYIIIYYILYTCITIVHDFIWNGYPMFSCAIIWILNWRIISDAFCFTCIVQWSEVANSCPMCKMNFQSIIHDVKSNEDYKTVRVNRYYI